MKKPIASLSLDDTLHPRHSVSGANVSAIKEAILAGVEIAPILVDDRTNKVIDGFHRVHAYEQLYGADYEIEVEEKHYRNKREMLADAIALNIGRGLDLSNWDKLRCITLAEDVGMPIKTLAALIQWQPDRLEAYRETRMGRTVDDRRIELKRSLRRHLNKPLTKAQEEVNKRASGMAPLFHINQTIALLETDLMPRDEHVVARLKDLYQLIEVWLAENGFDEGKV